MAVWSLTTESTVLSAWTQIDAVGNPWGCRETRFSKSITKEGSSRGAKLNPLVSMYPLQNTPVAPHAHAGAEIKIYPSFTRISPSLSFGVSSTMRARALASPPRRLGGSDGVRNLAGDSVFAVDSARPAFVDVRAKRQILRAPADPSGPGGPVVRPRAPRPRWRLRRPARTGRLRTPRSASRGQGRWCR